MGIEPEIGVSRRFSGYYMAVHTRKMSLAYPHQMDTLTPENRSRLMSRIRSEDTKPELIVRSMLHRMGFRFRIHRKDLPGRPDIVLPKHKKVVLVHGCFWHGHLCKIAPGPKSNTAYWSPKIETNRSRDQRNRTALIDLGWRVLELWECEIRDLQKTEERLQSFLHASPGLPSSPQ
jgi:DNA mismatch endonuclease (patch repair protein)